MEEKVRPPSSVDSVKPATQEPNVTRPLLSEQEVRSFLDQIPRLPDEALLEMILKCSTELKQRKSFATLHYGDSYSPPASPVFPDIPAPGEQEFVRIPEITTKDPAATEAETWRIILTSADPRHKPMALELRDVVIIGRTFEDSRVDIDLSQFGGQDLGMSRRHAMLRPGRYNLLVSDIGSANGTFLNRERVQMGKANPVQDGDMLTFGRLSVKITIVKRPKEAEQLAEVTKTASS